MRSYSGLSKTRILALAMATMAPAGTALGATVVKANNNLALNQPNSWVGGVVPGVSDVMQWDNTLTSAIGVQLGDSLAVEGIRILNPSGTLNLASGNLLTVGTGGIDMSAATTHLLIGASLSLAGSQAWTVAAIRNLNVTGVTNLGGYTLSIVNAGTINLSGNVSGSSSVLISGTGSLFFQPAAQENFTGSLTLASGTTTLNWSNTTLVNNLFPTTTGLIMGGGRLAMNTTGSLAGNYTQTLANTVLFTPGDSSYVPARNPVSGTLRLAFAGGVSRQTGATFNYASGTGQAFTVNASNTASGIIGGWFIVNSNSWARYVSGASVSVAPTYTGDTFGDPTQNCDMLGDRFAVANATTGSLRFNNPVPNVTQYLAGNNVIESGGILVTSVLGTCSSYIAPSASTDTLTSGNGQDLIVHQFDVNAPFTISATVTDNGATPIALTKNGPGTLVLSGANTFTGKVYINNGTVAVNANGNLGSPAAGADLFIHGGTLALTASVGLFQNAAGNHDRNITIGVKDAGINVAAGAAATISGVIGGPGSLVKGDSGTLVLTGSNSYGGTNVSAGTLQVGAGGATGTLGGGPVRVDGTLAFNRPDTVGVSAAITGAGGIVQRGTGTLLLTGTNTYAGPTTVAQGTLIATSPGASSAITIEAGLFRLGGSNGVLAAPVAIAGNPGAWSGAVDLTANTLVVQTAGGAAKSAAMAILANQVTSGKNGGGWNGNGISSSSNRGVPSAALALVDNADLGWTSLGGKTLDASSVLVTRALLGDANLDGNVDLGDYDRWYKNVGTGTAFSYAAGDLNLDGNIDLGDYDLWYKNVGAAPLSLTAPAGLAGNPLAAPEPTSLACVALAFLRLARRRGRLRTPFSCQ